MLVVHGPNLGRGGNARLPFLVICYHNHGGNCNIKLSIQLFGESLTVIFSNSNCSDYYLKLIPGAWYVWITRGALHMSEVFLPFYLSVPHFPVY